MTKTILQEQFDRAKGLLIQTRPIYNWSRLEEQSLLLILMCWKREKLIQGPIDMWVDSNPEILDRLTAAYDGAMEEFQRQEEYFGDL